MILIAGGMMIGSQLGGSLLGGVLQPLTRSSQYWANKRQTNQELSPSELTSLYQRDIINNHKWLEGMSKYGYGGANSAKFYTAYQQYPDLATIITRYRREIITRDQAHKEFKTLGYEKDQANQILNVSNQYLSPGDYTKLYQRGRMSIQDAEKRMHDLGYNTEEFLDLLKLIEFFPSPQDLVTWQAKEVFEPNTIEEFGLADEFENLDLSLFEKSGVNEEQARNFWIAHWEHPSLTQVREMFHRGIITKDILEKWYKLIELPPVWRDAITEYMYTPFTRVDVRRMHALGVLNDADVKRSYQDLGYSPVNAERMLQFTKAYNLPNERDLSRAMIIKAFNQGEINEEDTLAAIEHLGYSSSEAALILQLSINDKQENELEDKLDALIKNFADGIITETLLKNSLDGLGIAGIYRDEVISNAQRAKSKKKKLPSKADLESWFKDGLITEERFGDYMDKHGYLTEDIALYIESIQLKQSSQASKEQRERDLTKTEIEKTLELAVITKEQAREQLKKLGYADSEINILFELWSKE